MAKVETAVATAEVKAGTLHIAIPLLPKPTESSTGKSVNVIPANRMQLSHKGQVVTVQVNAYIRK